MIGTILTAILVIGLLVSINALYVAGEFATVSSRKTRIASYAEAGNRVARLLLPVLQDPHRLDNYIAASQVGITISSVALGIYGQQRIAPLITPWIAALPLRINATQGAEIAAAGASALLVLIVLTTLQVVFGELLPKSVAIQYPERTALLTTIPMRWSADFLLKPLIVLLNGSGILVLRALGVSHEGEHRHIHSPEEIIILVNESHEGGLLLDEERHMLSNVFRSRKTVAGEIVIPRTRIVASEVNRPLADALHELAESSYTRMPVYEKDLDHILGFVHMKDLFKLYRINPDASLREILRPAPYIPETLPLVEVWERLNEERSYLAIVFDEYGGTIGLISREDMIEELFGEIQDEYDQERAPITALGPGEFLVRGDMPLGTLNAELGTSLDHPELYTIGGLVLDALGRISRLGDEVTIDGILMRVMAVRSLSVQMLRLTIPAPDQSEEEA